jgi:hypothetical protein
MYKIVKICKTVKFITSTAIVATPENSKTVRRKRGGGGRRRIVHDIDINDYQVAKSRRADDEIVSRL